jgi:hypothetical protein
MVISGVQLQLFCCYSIANPSSSFFFLLLLLLLLLLLYPLAELAEKS